MIIVLPNADFSANNIGQIEVPEVIDENTLEFMANFTTVFTEVQQQAIQKFLKAIGYKESNSIYSKLTALIMPFLSTTGEEGCKNLIYGTSLLAAGTPSISEHGLAGDSVRLDLPDAKRPDFKEVTVMYASTAQNSTNFVAFGTNVDNKVFVRNTSGNNGKNKRFEIGDGVANYFDYISPSIYTPIAVTVSNVRTEVSAVTGVTENTTWFADANKSNIITNCGSYKIRFFPGPWSSPSKLYYAACTSTNDDANKTPLTVQEMITFNTYIAKLMKTFGME